MPYKNKIKGIYKISFETTEKTYEYIGHSTNCLQRNKQHIDGLKFNRHDNPIMQNLYNKYGFKCYKFEIIEEIIDDDLLILIEQNYIDKIPEDLKINIAKANRHIITDLIKQKISVTRKERIKNGSIDLSNAYSAKSKKKEVRYNTTFYNLIHKETNKQLNMSIKELSQYFEVDIKKIDKYIREVLREGSRCKTLYGYYIKRIG